MDLLELVNEFDLTALKSSPLVGTVFAALHGVLLGVVILSFVNCFLGYRIFRIFAALCGLGMGAVIGALLNAMEPDNTAMLMMGVLSALVLAAMTFVAFRFAAFLMGAFCGLAMGLMLVGWQSLNAAPDLTDQTVLVQIAAELIVPAVLLGVLCVLFYRPMIILSTGLGGLSGVYGLFELLGVDAGVLVWVLGLACAVLGIAVQFRINPRGTLPGPGGWKPKAIPSVPDLPKPERAKKQKNADAAVRIAPDTAAEAAPELDATARLTPELMRSRMAQAKQTAAQAPDAGLPEILPDMDVMMDRIQASVGETVREMTDEPAQELPGAQLSDLSDTASSPSKKTLPDDTFFTDIEQAIQDRMEEEQQKERYCIKCGERNDADARYCVRCGHELM